MTTATMPPLRDMPLDDLAELFTATPDTDAAWHAIIAECRRRDLADRARATRRGVTWAWTDQAHAQYLAAGEACRGHLLSRAGQAAGITEWSLWSGPGHVALKYASEELREFWAAHPRLTSTAYRRQLAASARAERDQHDTAQSGDTDDPAIVDGLRASGIRPEADAGSTPASDPGSARPVHGRRAAPPRETGPAGTAGPGFPVRGRPKPMTITYASPEAEPLETEWTLEPRFPRGHVVVLAGWRESGKGLLACNLASAVTTGKALPWEPAPRDPGDVVWIGAEDDRNEDMAWRLRAAGADLNRVHDFSSFDDGSPFELSALATQPGNTPELLTFIRELKLTCADPECGHVSKPGTETCAACGGQLRDPRMVVLDPLNALVMHGTIKTDAGARRVLGRLQHVARRTGVCVVVVHHFVKSGSIGGSQAIEDAPRWVYKVMPDPDSPDLKILHLHKCNVAKAEDVRYRITGDGHDVRIEWVDAADVQAEERSWRTPPAATPAAKLTPAQAKARGCRHSGTKFGTPLQCADCPARNLRGTPPPVRTPPPARAATWVASAAEPGPRGPVITDLPGQWPYLLLAQDACQSRAGHPLTWAEVAPRSWAAQDGARTYAIAGG